MLQALDRIAPAKLAIPLGIVTAAALIGLGMDTPVVALGAGIALLAGALLLSLSARWRLEGNPDPVTAGVHFEAPKQPGARWLGLACVVAGGAVLSYGAWDTMRARLTTAWDPMRGALALTTDGVAADALPPEAPSTTPETPASAVAGSRERPAARTGPDGVLRVEGDDDGQNTNRQAPKLSPPRSRVTLDSRGGMDEAVAARLQDAARRSVDDCKPKGTPTGDMLLRVVVGSYGDGKRATVIKDSVSDAALTQCLKKAAIGWSYPEAEAAADRKVEFILSFGRPSNRATTTAARTPATRRPNAARGQVAATRPRAPASRADLTDALRTENAGDDFGKIGWRPSESGAAVGDAPAAAPKTRAPKPADDFNALIAEARKQIAQGNSQQAIKQLLRAQRAKPKSAKPQSLLCSAYQKLGKRALALKACKAWLRREPNSRIKSRIEAMILKLGG